MSSYTTLLTQLVDNVFTITLNRPESYNACNTELTSELLDALVFASKNDEVRCVVITGAGKAFCSGQDLKDAPSGEGKRSLSDSLKNRYNPIIQCMKDMPKPIIAGINGVAAGAGLSLALGADLRVMSTNAKLVEAFIGIALVPDSGASYFYPRMMGYSKAFEFATLNKHINAEDAHAMGLVNMIASPTAFKQAVSALATTYAKGPTSSYGYVKKMLQAGMNSSLEEMLEMEIEYQQRAGESHDYAEGVQAFIEKRSPVFLGR